MALNFMYFLLFDGPSTTCDPTLLFLTALFLDLLWNNVIIGYYNMCLVKLMPEVQTFLH